MCFFLYRRTWCEIIGSEHMHGDEEEKEIFFYWNTSHTTKKKKKKKKSNSYCLHRVRRRGETREREREREGKILPKHNKAVSRRSNVFHTRFSSVLAWISRSDILVQWTFFSPSKCQFTHTMPSAGRLIKHLLINENEGPLSPHVEPFVLTLKPMRISKPFFFFLLQLMPFWSFSQWW